MDFMTLRLHVACVVELLFFRLDTIPIRITAAAAALGLQSKQTESLLALLLLLMLCPPTSLLRHITIGLYTWHTHPRLSQFINIEHNVDFLCSFGVLCGRVLRKQELRSCPGLCLPALSDVSQIQRFGCSLLRGAPLDRNGQREKPTMRGSELHQGKHYFYVSTAAVQDAQQAQGRAASHDEQRAGCVIM